MNAAFASYYRCVRYQLARLPQRVIRYIGLLRGCPLRPDSDRKADAFGPLEGVEIGSRAVIQVPKPGTSNHALRTQRL